jgi:DNA-binding response OmpR family regulator
MFNILIIDDDLKIINQTTDFLKKAGFKIYSSNSGENALKILNDKTIEINLIVLDFLMPVMNGIELCNKIRDTEGLKNIPIIMLTELQEISDKFIAFQAGADDYLIKPFEPLELMLRIKSILKRADSKSLDKETTVKKLTINKKNSCLVIDSTEIYLTSSEIIIIEYLYSNLDRVISSNELLEVALGYTGGINSTAIIRAHIKNLRNKIEKDPSTPKILVNIQGRGYTLNCET